MELILLEKVAKLGVSGQIVKVKPGFGRNYLIPKKKALRATAENKQLYELKRKELEAENQKKLDVARQQLAKVDGKDVVLIRQAGEDGRLFGSVSSKDISEQINSLAKLEINKSQVVMKNPIKYLGVHNVDVEFHAEAVLSLRVIVARSTDEAEDLKNAKQNNKEATAE